MLSRAVHSSPLPFLVIKDKIIGHVSTESKLLGMTFSGVSSLHELYDEDAGVS